MQIPGQISAEIDKLLDLRAREYRDSRRIEEAALATLSEQIGVEMEKSRQIAPVKSQIEEKRKLIAGYNGDRAKLLPKGPSKSSERLQELIGMAEKVRGYIRYFATQQSAIVGLKNEVQDLRQNKAPEVLRGMRDRHKRSGLQGDEWNRFLLTYSGNVDDPIAQKIEEAKRGIGSWRGTAPTAPIDAAGSYISPTDDLAKLPLATLEAEIARMERLVTADKETANKLAAVTKRIAEETAALERLAERLVDFEGARQRADGLVREREQGYVRVFDAIVAEERVLKELYAPLMQRLTAVGGTLSKLSFSVMRVADVRAWARRGEALFDLRGGPFKGIGSLEREANAMLAGAWTSGDPATVSKAMQRFRDQHQDALLEKAPFPRADQENYRPWSRRFAKWLYSTNHISIEYGIRYDGIDIRKLSPGTRGVVLVLLHLALDDADDRPLIIDQPEENLDPKSIYDELVPLFVAAKRKRQVIMVTHNANLVINTDADQIIVAEVSPQGGVGLPPISYQGGGLEQAKIRQMACDILEGGELAFRERAQRLRIAFAR